MRIRIDKKHFTKAERVFARLLQENRIPFRTKVKIGENEIDFLVGRLAVEIDGHEQVVAKNHNLADAGYIPIHFSNKEVVSDRQKVIEQIKQTWHEQLNTT